MKTKIITDSSSNILSLRDVEFAFAPLTISTEERSFVDNEDLDLDNMLKYLATYKGRSFSACPSVEDWLKCYEGADVIYVVVLTSGLSGTYNSAKNAADLYKEKNPNAKIFVFDTLSTGPEIRLVIEKIAQLVKKGKPFEEICNIVTEYSNHTRLYFALESFHNLAQNGRISKTAAVAAGLLGIRVLATASEKGVIEIINKRRGEKGALAGFLEVLEKANYSGGKVYIDHCKNPDFAKKIAAAIKENYKDALIKINETRGLCSYYAERGGILLGCECN